MLTVPLIVEESVAASPNTVIPSTINALFIFTYPSISTVFLNTYYSFTCRFPSTVVFTPVLDKLTTPFIS